MGLLIEAPFCIYYKRLALQPAYKIHRGEFMLLVPDLNSFGIYNFGGSSPSFEKYLPLTRRHGPYSLKWLRVLPLFSCETSHSDQ
jgi:hypothetical protein